MGLSQQPLRLAETLKSSAFSSHSGLLGLLLEGSLLAHSLTETTCSNVLCSQSCVLPPTA